MPPLHSMWAGRVEYRAATSHILMLSTTLSFEDMHRQIKIIMGELEKNKNVFLNQVSFSFSELR